MEILKIENLRAYYITSLRLRQLAKINKKADLSVRLKTPSEEGRV